MSEAVRTIKDVTVSVTDRCNSRCSMCCIWASGPGAELSAEEFRSLFQHPEFEQIENINITGGEPILRDDLVAVLEGLLEGKPLLKRLFIATNGSLPDKTVGVLQSLRGSVAGIDLCLTVSIDGDRKRHNAVRGVESYDQARETLTRCRKEVAGLRVMISTTLTSLPGVRGVLEHVAQVAREEDLEYSFRVAAESALYYRNWGQVGALAAVEVQSIIDFCSERSGLNPFLEAQSAFLKRGEMDIMELQGQLRCQAGQIFVYVASDGAIYPCIFSKEPLGNKFGFYPNAPFETKRVAACPCCTECTFYPMHFFGRQG